MPRSKRDTVRGRTPSAPSPESPLLSKRKVFAQRKFAQGVTTPYTGSAPPSPPAPCSRPASPAAPPAPLPPDGPLPKTEDFITFLCFRGTSRLPAHLEKFNHPPLPGSGGSKVERSSRSGGPASGAAPPAAAQEHSPSRGGSSTRVKDQKGANGLRQNGHAKMSATKPLFQKHNNVLHSRSARGSPSSVSGTRTERTAGSAPALKRAQVVLRKLSHSSLIAKKKSQSAKLRAQKAVDKQARMLQRLVVSSSLRYPSSGPAIKLTTLKQQRPFARLTRAQIARGARQRPPAAGGSARPRPAGSDPAKPRPVTTELGKPKPSGSDPAKPRPNIADPSKPRPNTSDPAKPRPNPADPSKPRPNTSDPAKPRPNPADPSKPRPNTSDASKPRPAAPSAPDTKTSKPAASERSTSSETGRSRRTATDAVARIRQRARIRQQMARKLKRTVDRRQRGEPGRSSRDAAARPAALRRSWMSADSRSGRRSNEDASDSERTERRPPAGDGPARPKVALASRSKSKFWFWVEEPVPRSDDEEPAAAERPTSPRTLRDGRRVQPAASSSSEESEEPEGAPPAGRTLRDGTVLPAAGLDSDRPPAAEQKTGGGRATAAASGIRPAHKKADKPAEPANRRTREEKESSSEEDERTQTRSRDRRGWRQAGRPAAAAAERGRSLVPAAGRERRRPRRPTDSSSEVETETSRSTTRETSRQRAAQSKAKALRLDTGPAAKATKGSPGPARQLGTDAKATTKISALASRRSHVSSDDSSKKEKNKPAKRTRHSLPSRKKSLSSSEDEVEDKASQKEKPRAAQDAGRKTQSSVKDESSKSTAAKKKPNGRAAAPPTSHSELESRDEKPGPVKPESEVSSSESDSALPVRRAARSSGGPRAPPPPRRPPSSSSDEREPATRRPLRAGAGLARRRSWETPPPPPAAPASSDSERSTRVTRSRRPELLPIAGAVRKRAFVPGRRGWADSSSGTEERPASPPAASRRRPPAHTSSSEERASPPPPAPADKPRRTLRKRSEAFFSYDIIESDSDDEPVGVARPRARPPARPSDAERSTPTAAAASTTVSAAASGASASRSSCTERRPTVERREASSTAVEAGAGTATPPPAAKDGLKRESSVTGQSTDRESSRERPQKKRPRPASPFTGAKHTPPKKKSSSSRATDGSFLSKLKESAQRRISRLSQRKGGSSSNAGSSAATRPAMGVYEFDSDENLASLTSLRQSDEPVAVKTVSEATSTSEDRPPAQPERSTCTIAVQVNMDEEMLAAADTSSGTQTQTAAAQQTDSSVQSQTESPAVTAVSTETRVDGLQPQPAWASSVTPQRPPSGGQSQPASQPLVSTAAVERPTQAPAQSPVHPQTSQPSSPAVSRQLARSLAQKPSQPPLQSAGQPAFQTVAQSVTQPVTQPVPQVTTQPVAHSVTQYVPQMATQPVTQPIAAPVVQPVTQPIAPAVVQPVTQPIGQAVAQPVVQPLTQALIQPLAQPMPQRASQPLPLPPFSAAVSQRLSGPGEPLLAAGPRLVMPVSLLRPQYQLGGGEVASRPLQLVSVTAPRCSVQPPPGLGTPQLQPLQQQPQQQPRFHQVQYQLGAAGMFSSPLPSGSYTAGQCPLLPAPPAGKRPLAPASWATAPSGAPLAPATWSAAPSGTPLAPADRLAPIKPVHPHGSSSADWRRTSDAAVSSAGRFVPRVPPPGLIRLPTSSTAPLHYPLPYSGPLLAGAPPFAPRLALLGASQLHGTGVAVLSGPPPPPLPPLPQQRVAGPVTSPVDSKAAVRAQLRQAAAALPAPTGSRVDGGAGSPADVKVPLSAVASAAGRIPPAAVPVAPPTGRPVPLPGRPVGARPLGPAPWPPAHASRSPTVTSRPTSAPTATSSPAATAPSGRPASATLSRGVKTGSPTVAAVVAPPPAGPLAVPPSHVPAVTAPAGPAVPRTSVPALVPASVPVAVPALAQARVQAQARAPVPPLAPAPVPISASAPVFTPSSVSVPAPVPASASVSTPIPILPVPVPPGTPTRHAAAPERPRVGSTVSSGPVAPAPEKRVLSSTPVQSQPVSVRGSPTTPSSVPVLPPVSSITSAASTAAVGSGGSGKADSRPAKRPAQKGSSAKTAPPTKKSASVPPVSAAAGAPAAPSAAAVSVASGVPKSTPKSTAKSADKPPAAPKSAPKPSSAPRSSQSAARAGKRKAGEEAASSSSEAERRSAASPLSPASRGRRPGRASEDSGRESTPQSRRSSQSPAPARRARKVSSLELGSLQEAPVFRPTEKEFTDPLGYIEKIRPEAERYGLCRVVPPPGFKPECRVDDDMRFVAYNHYVHKVFRRWGPNFRELLAIRRYLEQQQIDMEDLPLVGGMEVDLPGLYHTVQRLGGLNDVITGRRWAAVADLINIPKCAQDRAAKLDQIYCKFLLGYTALTEDERKRLRIEVETGWRRREQVARCRQLQSEDEHSDEDDDDAAECIVKGKTVSLSAFYRVARNTASLLFKHSDPKPETVEDEYWKVVNERDRHICVYSGSIDSGVQGYGFVCDKKSQTSRLAWNLKVLSNNPGSVLRSMGHVMGVTVPTLHMSMAFTTGCWYSDPHSLPWIEYLHTGAAKIWYSVPSSGGDALRRELAELMPGYLRHQPVWLPSDTAMVPPDLLADRGVPVARAVQQPGEFVISFPRAFTASIGTGYTLSESVFFATPDWLASATEVYDKLKLSGEPGVFSLDRLVFGVCSDPRASLEALARCQPLLLDLQRQQHEQQQRLQQLGITDQVKISAKKGGRSRKSATQEEEDRECDTCRRTLYSAMVENAAESVVYCLEDAAELLRKPGSKLEGLKLQLMYSQSDFEELIHQVDERIAELGSKQSSAKKKQKKSA